MKDPCVRRKADGAGERDPGAQFTPAHVPRLPVDGTGTPPAILEFIEQKLIARGA